MPKSPWLLLWIASLPLPAQSVFDTKGWTWQRPVTSTYEEQTYLSLTLDWAVVDESRSDLNDLRLIDQNTRLVPFSLIREGSAARIEPRWRDATLINKTFKANNYERFVLDLKEPVLKNLLEVSLSGTNFGRRALLEGSSDSVQWETLLEKAWLFRVERFSKTFRVDRLSFPDNNFRYLRLTVYQMPDDPRRFEVETARVGLLEVPSLPETPLTLKSQTPLLDEEEKTSGVELDVGSRHLPLATLELDFGDTFFHRAYELYGRYSLVETQKRTTETGFNMAERDTPWRYLKQGVLYRVRDGETVSQHTAIKELNCSFRYLKLVLRDDDDRPLEIKNVTLKRYPLARMVFAYQPGQNYRLIGGNPEAAAPRFDLARSLPDLKKHDLASAELGSRQILASAVERPPWSERNAWLVWVALILAVTALSFLVKREIKKLKPGN